MRAVARPRRDRLEPDGLAEPERFVVGGPQQAAVVLVQGGVGRLVGLAPELDGRLLAGALDLAIPHQEHARDDRLDEGRDALLRRGHQGRDPRAVAILEEPDGPALVAVVRPEVAGDPGRITAQHPVQQRRVVGEVEAELLEPPFEAPVRLADEQEARVHVANGAAGVPPELAERGGLLRGDRRHGPAAPGRPEDIVEHEHRHRADHPVAARGDLAQRLGHRPGDIRMAVVELGRIQPRPEVRVATVGDPVAALGAHLEPFVGELRSVGRVRVDEPVRVAADPRMLRRGVVGDEIEDQRRDRPRPGGHAAWPARPRRRGSRPARRR